MARRIVHLSPFAKAALLASEWAHQIGLPAGNLWEPAIVRNVLKEWHRLGADDNAWGFVEALYRIQLGLPVQE